MPGTSNDIAKSIYDSSGFLGVTVYYGVWTPAIAAIESLMLSEETNTSYRDVVIASLPVAIIVTFLTYLFLSMNVVGIFLGEAVAYALMSAPLSYILSCILGHFSSIFANYASVAVVIAILSSILVILLSSIYPLYKASRLVTPSLERDWTPKTKPRGNTWDIPLPLALESEEEACGMLVYITNYLKSYGSEAVSFIVDEIKYEKTDNKTYQ